MTRYPTEEECLSIMREHGMLPNIIDHSRQVMHVALALYEALMDKTVVSRPLIQSGALLHDIAKTRTIETGERRHDLIGGEMMRALGFVEIAQIVESHVVFEGFAPDGPLEEREFIFYADKRVMHDRIVSLDERVEDLVERYGVNDQIKELIRNNRTFVDDLETKLARYMRLPMEDAIDRYMATLPR